MCDKNTLSQLGAEANKVAGDSRLLCAGLAVTKSEMEGRNESTQHKNAAPRDLDPHVVAYNEYLAEQTGDLFENYQHEREEWEQIEHESEAENAQPIAPIIRASTLFSRPRMVVQAYIQDFIYAGALTGIFAEPKVGKSTLVWHLLQAISKGTSILDRKATKGIVLYVSEQNEGCFVGQAKEVPGLAQNNELGILLVESNRKENPRQPDLMAQISTWADQLEFWASRIKAFNADVFVIDTLGAYFHLPAGGENDNAIMQERMAQLRTLFKIKSHLGIVLIHHNGKTNDKATARQPYLDSSRIRGASAILGAMDHAVILNAVDKKSPNRFLTFEGRYAESHGMTMQIRLDQDMSYTVLETHRPYGDKDENREDAGVRLMQLKKEKLLGVLERTPDKAQTIAVLEKIMDTDRRTLKFLLTELKASMIGEGVKGNPIRYWTDEAPSMAAKRVA
jgi:hypothetical protein